MSFKTNHPQINEVNELYEKEKHPFTKIHRMIDLFEIIIKTHTAYIIGDYFRIKRISEGIKGLLAEGLMTPSLGMWQVFNRVIMEDLVVPKSLTTNAYELFLTYCNQTQVDSVKQLYKYENEAYHLIESPTEKQLKTLLKISGNSDYEFSEILFYQQFYMYFFDWDKKVTSEFKIGNQVIPNPIHLRNKYAHGATPIREQCEKDLAEYKDVLEIMLTADWLQKTAIVVFERVDGVLKRLKLPYENEPFPFQQQCDAALNDEQSITPQMPYLLNKEGQLLSLFPIISFKTMQDSKSPSLLFFNDLKKIKKNKVSLLNYPHAIHLHDGDIFNQFMDIINIFEWKKNTTGEFKDLIEELTDHFQGREQEKQVIHNFMTHYKKGFLFIYGSPGIGKSALIASVIHQLKQNRDKIFIEKTHVIEYFIRRNSVFASPLTMLDNLNRKLENIVSTNIPLGSSVEEKRDFLHQRLQQISSKLKDEKIVICIDGIDEGIETLVHQYLVTNSYRNILFIYASRKIQEIYAMYLKINVEEKEQLTIAGLKPNDIRALLYKVTNKYELLQQDENIESVTKKSLGNPLYVKLLCAEIEKGTMTIQNANHLPVKINDFYAEILLRIKNSPDSQLLLDGLFVFVAAKDYLNVKQLQLILNINSSQSEIIIDKLHEVLIENLEEEHSYQLFHESLREYLVETRREQVIDAELKIIHYCLRWSEFYVYKGSVLQYPLKYLSKHLLNVQDKQRLWDLIHLEDYIVKQAKQLGHYYNLTLFEDMLRFKNLSDEETLKISSKVAALHQRVTVDLWHVMDEVATKNKQVTVALHTIEQYKGAEKFLLYIQLLSKISSSEYVSQMDKKKMLEMAVQHFERNAELNVIGFKWTDYLSLQYMVYLLVTLKKYDVNVLPFLTRSDLQNLDVDVIYEELQVFDLKDADVFAICEALFLHNKYEPCLQAWVILLCKQHLIDEAIAVTEKMVVIDLQVEAYCHIAVKRFEQSNNAEPIISKIKELLHNISKPYMKAIACSKLAFALKKIGEYAESERFLKEAQDIAAHVQNLRNQSHAYREIIIAMLHIKNVQQATTLFHSLTLDNWNKGIVLNEIVLFLHLNGETEKAELVVKEALHVVKATSDYRDKRYLVRITCITLSKLGRFDEVFELLQQADEVWNTMRVLRAMSLQLHKRAMLTEIMAYQEQLVDIYSKLIMVVGYVQHQLQNSQCSTNLNMYGKISEKLLTGKVASNEQFLGNIHSNVLRVATKEPLREIQELKAELNRGIDESVHCINLARLSTALWLNAEVDEAKKYMAQAISNVKTMENAHDQAHVYSEIAKELCLQKNFQEAIELTKEIEFPWNVTPVVRQLANELTIDGQLDLLFELIRHQKLSVAVLVMLDQTMKVLKYPQLQPVLTFVKEDVYSEVTKTHVYALVLEQFFVWKEEVDVFHPLQRILPDIINNRMLLGKWMFIFVEVARNRANHLYKDSVTLFSPFVVLAENDEPPQLEYTTTNLIDWLTKIDKSQASLIPMLVEQVNRSILSPQQFNDLIKSFIDNE